MIVYKNVTLPPTIAKKFEAVVCDICKKRSETSNWDAGSYNVLDTKVEIREGCAFPEHTDVETKRFDICPDCFLEKLVPFLKSLGAEPTVVDEDTY